MSKSEVPWARSCLPADSVEHLELLANDGAFGTLTLSSSNGKYSLDGRPPPSDTMPGFFKNLAAPLSELGSRVFDSMLKRSAHNQSAVIRMR